MKTLFSVFLVHFQPHSKKSFFLWAERASSLLIGSSLENRAAITEQLESAGRRRPLTCCSFLTGQRTAVCDWILKSRCSVTYTLIGRGGNTAIVSLLEGVGELALIDGSQLTGPPHAVLLSW